MNIPLFLLIAGISEMIFILRQRISSLDIRIDSYYIPKFLHILDRILLSLYDIAIFYAYSESIVEKL